MSQCFAYVCKHRQGRTSLCRFFRFPKDKKSLKEWIHLCRRQDTVPKPYHRLCSCHFRDGKKEYGPTLLRTNEQEKKRSLFSVSNPEKRVSKKDAEVVIPADERPASPPLELPDLPSTAELPSTEYFLETIAKLEEEKALLKSELELLKFQKNTKIAFCFLSVANNLETFRYYTGLRGVHQFDMFIRWLSSESLDVISYIDGWKPQMPLEDQLLLTLMKLRINSDYTDLANRFQVSRQVVRNVFLTISYRLHSYLYPRLKESIPIGRLKGSIPNGRLKNYNILDFFPVNLREHADTITQLVACLINVDNLLVNQGAEDVIAETEENL